MVVAYKLLMDSPQSKGQIYNIGGTCEEGYFKTLIELSLCERYYRPS